MIVSPDRAISFGLNVLQQDPQQLVTSQLLEHAVNPNAVKAIPFRATIRRVLEDDYEYPLAVVIAEKGKFAKPVETQEDDTEFWGMRLNTHRRFAIDQGQISKHDQVLLSLIAYDYYPQSVFVEIFILAQHLHGKKIGGNFMTNFKNIMAQMGYSSISGIRTKPNLSLPKKFRLTPRN